MAKVNNSTLAAVIRTFDNADPNGEVWARAKALITPENEADAAAILAADKTFVKLAKANVAAKAAARKNRPAAEPGTLKYAIQNYTPQAKTETFTKANGEVIACTPKQKAAWEAGRSRFVAANEAKGDTKVTQGTEADALAKLLADKPEVLAALAELLTK